MSNLTCAQMRELAPELALEILSGYERATAQAHLHECPGCRAHVAALTQVSDTLLALVPGVEPPVGFEDRVLSRMGMTPRQPRQPQRRWFPIAVAAAVAALVFGLGGWVIGGIAMSHTAVESAAAEFRFAALHTADNRQIGQVFTYQGQPPWMYMSVATEPNVTTVACQLVERNGTAVPVGTFGLSGGKGSWGAELTIDPNTVVGARLVDDHGTVLATATFTSDAAGWHAH
jgi:hypothetical protein